MSALSTQELSLEVLGRFRVIFRSANKHFEAIEKSVGVSGAQLWALSEIVSAGELTVSQLARTMALHQSTTSNLIERLESRKLVLRVRSTEDRRVVNVLATAAGKIALAQAPGPFRGILPDALMRMDHEGLSALKSSLDKVLELLEHKSAQASMEPLGSPLNESE